MNRKLTIAILFLFPLTLFIPMMMIHLKSELSLLPSNQISKSFVYADSSETGGQSSITNFEVKDSSIDFGFILKEGVEFPYAGFQIDYSTDTSALDISSFTHLEVEIEAENLNKITVYCKTFIDGITKFDEYNTHLFLEYELDLSDKKKVHRFNLDKLYVPQWWYKEMGVSENRIGDPDFSKFLNIAFSSPPYMSVGKNYSVTIKNIKLIKETKNIDLAIIIIILTLYVLAFFIYLVIKKRDEKPMIIPYKELDLKNTLDEDSSKIVNYISENYNVKDLSVARISEETGISVNKIPAILKETFQMTFKQYLNSIRLAEVKRLLLETDRQVAEIAYQVGYRNVTHFHRIFKSVEKISPNEFRKNKKENNKE